jgi:flagellar hook-length control protein FliK
MRLPEPSSSQGGPFATPPRGRDSQSPLQSPNGNGTQGLLSSSAGIGFFRPSVDFNSIFRGNDGLFDAPPIPNQSATASPRPTESTARVRQSDADENTIEPVDEEEQEEAVEKNDSVAVQSLATVAEASQTVENERIDADILNRADVSDDQTVRDLTNESPADSATETTTPTQLTKSTDASKQANSTDSGKIAAPTNELSSNVRAVESAGNGTPKSQEKAAAITPGAITSEMSRLDDAESTPSETSVPANLQIAGDTVTTDIDLKVAGDTGLETNQVVQAGNSKLAAQSQQQVDQAATAGTTSTGESDAASNRTSRSGRGRNAGNAAQKGRSGQAESPTATPDRAAVTSSESAVGQPDTIDPALASGTADGTPNPASVADPITAASVQSSLAEAGIVASQAVGTSAPEAGNRPVAVGGPSGDLAAIGPSSSDSSGRNGDQLSSRNAENLSRTDIADRARLIHRISKAFTKMGVDGGQIRMKMHPETLGGVLLEMRVRGRNVEATVTADNEAARGLLQQQLSELRQRLESQGMTVQRLEVALRNDTATGGSLLNDQRGEMFSGDRGSDGYGQPRRSNSPKNAERNGVSAAINGSLVPGQANPMALSRGPAAPGTLDLRL